MTNYPRISIVIPTYNEEKNIKKCLNSIFKQKYPKNRLEVIVVDDDSTDSTVEIIRGYPVKILRNGHRHGEIGKMIGLKKTTGDFFMYLDADNELIGDNWFQKMAKPLLEDTQIIGVFTAQKARKTDPAIERYLSFDPLQRDAIYQYFSPSIDDVTEEGGGGYFICRYKEDKIPPAGQCLYRREELLKLIGNFNMFLELDFLVILVRSGFDKFAYVPNAGLYHHHAASLKELLKKRRYNLTRVYLKHVQNNLYTWFDLWTLVGILRILAWILYANLMIPSIVVGIYKSVKYRDLAGMYEPLVNLLVTDTLLVTLCFNVQNIKLLLGESAVLNNNAHDVSKSKI